MLVPAVGRAKAGKRREGEGEGIRAWGQKDHIDSSAPVPALCASVWHVCWCVCVCVCGCRCVCVRAHVGRDRLRVPSAVHGLAILSLRTRRKKTLKPMPKPSWVQAKASLMDLSAPYS